MEREARYAAVGAFVLLVLAMAVLFVYWYAEGHERRDYTRYEVYFDGTVSGLARGAPVRYLGVDVGRVVRMSIDPRNSSRVEVIVDIDSSAPVSANTLAELSLQGVTGLLYIDLIVSPAGRKLEEAVPSLEYPVIRSARSNFDVFLASLPGLVSTVGEVSERFSRIFSDQNIGAIGGALGNINEASAQLPATLREIKALTSDLRGASAEITAAAASVRSITERGGPELLAALQHVRVVADNLASTSAKLDALVQDNRQDVRVFARDGLPELERLLRDGRAAALEFRDLSRSLRENPSRLIYQTKSEAVEIPP
jgi:phospholipid/cholesterol/gamma-HCH transport system substrate-binding protein